MKNIQSDIQIFDEDSILEGAFTVAVTDIFTLTAHSFRIGDVIHVATDNTLPAGLVAATNYYVVGPVTANTFKVSASQGGPAVDVTDTGTGTQTLDLKGRVIYTGDHTTVNIMFNFASTPTMTLKVQGSSKLDTPDFYAAQSTTNRWDYMEIVDLEDGTIIDGDTGIACSGSADNRIIQVNTNGLSWVTLAVTAWTAGKLGAYATLYDNN